MKMKQKQSSPKKPGTQISSQSGSAPGLPRNFAGVSMLERQHWATCGPLIFPRVKDLRGDVMPAGRHGNGPGSWTVWPSWGAWLKFYGRVRSEYMTARRRRLGIPLAELLYQACSAGEDPDQALERLRRERKNDPRARGALETPS